MRAAVVLILSVTAVNAVPRPLPQQSGGRHHGGASPHGFTRINPHVPGGTDYGAGIILAQPPPGHVGHFNPFLPEYHPVSDDRAADLQGQSSASPQGVQQEIDPADLNQNPGIGNSGPLGPMAAVCGAGLNCVEPELCDPYTGFVVGVLKNRPPANPNQPTVALQRCPTSSPGQEGVCCRGTLGPSPSPTPAVKTGPEQQGSNPFLPQPPPDQGQTAGAPAGDFSNNPFLSGGGFEGGATCEGDQQCVEQKLCDDEGYIITDGAGLLDIRRPSQSSCRDGRGQLGVCCRRRPPPPTTAPSRQITCSADQECVTPDLCDAEGRVVTDGAGLIDIRFDKNKQYCVTAGGPRGVCCSPEEARPRRTEILCFAEFEDCVAPQLCDDEGFIIEDGAGLLDVRVKRDQFCRTPSKGEGVCCARRPPPPTTAPSRQITCSADQECVTPDLCDAEGRVVTDGAGLIDIRFDKNKQYCLTKEGSRGVCCLPEKEQQSRSEIVCFEGIEDCVAPQLCDDEGFIIEDGAGLLDIRTTSDTFCRRPGSGEGVCCARRPSPPTTRQITCSTDQECVTPDLCDAEGRVVTDGAGLIDIRFDKNKQYCLTGEGSRGVCCLPEKEQQSRSEIVCFEGIEDCVAPQLCDDEGFIIEDGAGLLDIRTTSDTFCRRPGSGEGVCCAIRPSPPTTAPSRQITCSANQECVTPDLCDAEGRIVTDGAGLIDIRFDKNKAYCLTDTGERGRCCSHDSGVTPGLNCGQSLGVRILGVNPDKTEASFGELPWQAAIIYNNFTFICGGSLIGEGHVLTAAHCVNRLQSGDIQVRLGEYQVNAESEPLPYQDVRVARISLHPDFRRGPLFNDVAVLKLSSPAQLDSHIQPICLPEPGQKFTGRCVVSGWGKDAFNDGQFSPILKKVRLPMVANDVCQNNLRKTRLGRFFGLDGSFVCAGGEEGVDACRGDGGGPLACSVDGVYVQAGITAWGIGCGEKDVPGVYASTEAAIDFIRQSIAG